MFKTIEGIYRQGKIELAESPGDMPDQTRVVVTFLDPPTISLSDRGMDEAQAADLRSRLESFAEEWDSPEMKIYDHYDVAKSGLQTR
jgi:hypothetical protein